MFVCRLCFQEKNNLIEIFGDVGLAFDIKNIIFLHFHLEVSFKMAFIDLWV